MRNSQDTTQLRSTLDARLYLIVDSNVTDTCIRDAVAGGVTLVQLRDKSGTTRDRIARARQVRLVLGESGVPLYINDRIDIALASDADGVHLGQEDMSAEDARRILPQTMGLGLTVRSIEEASAAPVDVLDYISIGGVFPTDSKHNTTAPLGLAGLSNLVQLLRKRNARCLTAIAGINADNIADVMGCGVDGVAIISAITRAPSPQDTSTQLRARIDAVRVTL